MSDIIGCFTTHVFRGSDPRSAAITNGSEISATGTAKAKGSFPKPIDVFPEKIATVV